MAEAPFRSKNSSCLVLISQGLSPNTFSALEAWSYQNIYLLTAVTKNNKQHEKTKILNKLEEKGSQVFHYPMEDEYTTLLRIVGPLCAYYFIYRMLQKQQVWTVQNEKKLYDVLSQSEKKLPKASYFNSFGENSNIVLLAHYPLISYIKNLACKFEEGGFFTSVRVVDYLEFSHGFFQNIEYQRNQGVINHFVMFASQAKDKEFRDKCIKMLGQEYPVWQVESELTEDLQILEYEMLINHFILKWLEKKNIDQISWFGKEKQNVMYENKNWSQQPEPGHL